MDYWEASDPTAATARGAANRAPKQGGGAGATVKARHRSINVREVHGIAQSRLRLHPASREPVEQSLVDLDRSGNVSGFGLVVCKGLERRFRVVPCLELVRRIEFKLAQSREGSILAVQPGQLLFRMPEIRFSRLRLPDLCPGFRDLCAHSLIEKPRSILLRLRKEP